MTLGCAPGSTTTAFLCLREHQNCLLVLPGAKVTLFCTPLRTGTLTGSQLTLSRHYRVGIWHGGVLGVHEGS